MTQTIQLPAKLDFEGSRGLHAALLEYRGSPITLDAGLVTFVGGLALQLIVCAARTWKSEGTSFRISTISQSFSDGLKRLGVSIEDITGETSK